MHSSKAFRFVHIRWMKFAAIILWIQNTAALVETSTIEGLVTSPAQSPTSPDLLPRRLQSSTTIAQQGNAMIIQYQHDSNPTSASVTLFKQNCTTPLSSDGIVTVSQDEPTVDSTYVTYTLIMDGDGFQSSNIVTFDSSSTGTISFCAKLDMADVNNVTIQPKFTHFNIGFNLTELEMEYTANAGPIQYSQDFDIDINFAVTSCECDADFQCFTTPQDYAYVDSAPVLRICLTPSTPDVQVSNFEFFMTNSQTSATYQPVSFGDGNEITDEITSVSVRGNILMIKTRVVRNMFLEGNTEVLVEGSVFMGEATGKIIEFLPFETTIQVLDESQNAGCFFDLLRRFF